MKSSALLCAKHCNRPLLRPFTWYRQVPSARSQPVMWGGRSGLERGGRQPEAAHCPSTCIFLHLALTHVVSRCPSLPSLPIPAFPALRCPFLPLPAPPCPSLPLPASHCPTSLDPLPRQHPSAYASTSPPPHAPQLHLLLIRLDFTSSSYASTSPDTPQLHLLLIRLNFTSSPYASTSSGLQD